MDLRTCPSEAQQSEDCTLQHSPDESNSDYLHQSQSQQPSPNPQTSHCSFDGSPQPWRLCTEASRSSEASQRTEKRTQEDVDELSPDPEGEQSYIDSWLSKGSLTRTNSCPSQFTPCSTPAPDPGEEQQQPLLDFLPEMSQPPIPHPTQRPVTSALSSQPPMSHLDYRSVLRNNGVYIDHMGSKMPQELRTFVESEILKERSSLPPEAIAEAMKVVERITDNPGCNIHDLTGTAILPVQRSDVGCVGRTPWCSVGLPRNKIYHIPLTPPEPDLHFGYPTGAMSTWTTEEMAAIDHPSVNQLTQPAKGSCLPFFVVEVTSEAMGGTIWQAENQAAGSGAYCVKAMRWLFRDTCSSEDQTVVDPIAFSACASHREVVVHVHHYSVVDDRYYMSLIGTFPTTCKVQVQKCNNVIQNIFDYCLGSRQEKARDAVKRLYRYLERWEQI